jgi:hypothetical protein
MISEILYIGNYACTIGGYIVRNKDLIITSYNIIDIARFSFYVADRIGLLELIKSSVCAKKYDNVIFLSDVEEDDFIIVDIMK